MAKIRDIETSTKKGFIMSSEKFSHFDPKVYDIDLMNEDDAKGLNVVDYAWTYTYQDVVEYLIATEQHDKAKLYCIKHGMDYDAEKARIKSLEFDAVILPTMDPNQPPTNETK